MSILDTFYILFDSDASKLNKGLDESDKKSESLLDKLKKVDTTSSEVGKGLFDVVSKFAGLLGIGVSLGALAHGIKETAEAYDTLDKLAARFNTTARAVENFREAAGLLGITEEKSTAALMGLDAAVQDTLLGMGRAARVFQELGVRVSDFRGRALPTTQVMAQLAARMQHLQRGTQIRIMERLGLDPSLLKLFNTDLVKLQERMEQIDRVSGFNLQDAVKRSKEYMAASKALGLEVNLLRTFMEKVIETFKIAALPFFTEAMKRAAAAVKSFTDWLMAHKNIVQGFFIALGAAILYFLVPAAIAGAVALWAMIAPFAAVGAAVAAVGAVFVLAYDDIKTFFDGGDSLLGRAIARWPILGYIIKGIAALFQFLVGVGKLVFATLSEMIGGFLDKFILGIKVILKGLQFIIDKIPGMKGALDSLNLDPLTGKPSGKEYETWQGLMEGQAQLAAASASPMASQTSNSMMMNSRTTTRTATVTVDKIEVHTQATDAEGISKQIGNTLGAQLRQTAANYDDGVLG